MAKRRTPEEILAAVEEVKAMRSHGEPLAEALEKAKLSQSVYYKHYKNPGATLLRGSVNVGALPPRPKKSQRGGYQKARAVDMNDVASLAGRISKLDKKIAEVDALASERRKLADVLLKLLKA
jgi:hypothetical protein